jgi:hypothetical protein
MSVVRRQKRKRRRRRRRRSRIYRFHVVAVSMMDLSCYTCHDMAVKKCATAQASLD